MYTIVKLYQTSICLDKKNEIKKMDTFVKNSIVHLKNKFQDSYHKQIKIAYDNYIILKDSDKKSDNEKYEIFVKLFLS